MQKEKKGGRSQAWSGPLGCKYDVNKTTKLREVGRAAFFERTLINKGALGPARETLTHTRERGEESN